MDREQQVATLQLNETKTKHFFMFVRGHKGEYLRFLGVTIDNQLSWKVHIATYILYQCIISKEHNL